MPNAPESRGPVQHERHAHGTRNRYLCGCHCADCRKAAAEYARAYRKRRAAGLTLVSSARARRHIMMLGKHHIGRDAIAAATDLSISTIDDIRIGARKRVHCDTERLILAVGKAQALDGALVCAKDTWVLIDELVEEGYLKSRIARALGYAGKGIPIGKSHCTVRNADRVRRLHQKWTS